MPSLTFNTYTIKNMEYNRNPNFEKNLDGQIPISTDIKTDSTIKNDEIFIDLNVTVGSLKDKNIPFEVKCSIQGDFKYNETSDLDALNLDETIRKNAVAILYPYVRSIVSMLTNSANEFPTFNMPTINVNKILDQK